jgi:hypothetical protein
MFECKKQQMKNRSLKYKGQKNGRKHISLVHQQQMSLNSKQSLIPAVLPGSTRNAPYPHSLHTLDRQYQTLFNAYAQVSIT